MKIWQRVLLYFLLISGLSIMFILPIYSVYTGLIVGQAEKVKFNLYTGGILLTVGLVFSKWILKKYERKLQAIQTVEEMGQTPATNFIIVRIFEDGGNCVTIGCSGFHIQRYNRYKYSGASSYSHQGHHHMGISWVHSSDLP